MDGVPLPKKKKHPLWEEKVPESKEDLPEEESGIPFTDNVKKGLEEDYDKIQDPKTRLKFAAFWRRPSSFIVYRSGAYKYSSSSGGDNDVVVQD